MPDIIRVIRRILSFHYFLSLTYYETFEARLRISFHRPHLHLVSLHNLQFFSWIRSYLLIFFQLTSYPPQQEIHILSHFSLSLTHGVVGRSDKKVTLAHCQQHSGEAIIF